MRLQLLPKVVVLWALMAVTFLSSCAQTPPPKATGPAQRMLYDANGVRMGLYVFMTKREGVLAEIDGFKVAIPIGLADLSRPDEWVFATQGSVLYSGENCSGQTYTEATTGGAGGPGRASPEFLAYFEARRMQIEDLRPTAPVLSEEHGPLRPLALLKGPVLVELDIKGFQLEFSAMSSLGEGATCSQSGTLKEPATPVTRIIDISKKFVPPFRLK